MAKVLFNGTNRGSDSGDKPLWPGNLNPILLFSNKSYKIGSGMDSVELYFAWRPGIADGHARRSLKYMFFL